MGLIPRTGVTGATDGLCTSAACINVADSILGGMALNHTAIDPCTNFDECKHFSPLSDHKLTLMQ